ncbi:tyrosine-type recombinase/integrase [Ensifer sp. IC3342]|nr:tyrosine-type recombinase/integrase [Ensifer sp. BRP08]MCA1445033.1 tyrosine-type recombinase/integrase [Ensifer sp. IC3342]
MQKLDLTDDVVRNLPFAPVCNEFADSTVDNMRVVVTTTRKAFFYVPDFIPGSHVRWRLGWFPEIATERARELARQLNQVNQATAHRSGEEPVEADPLHRESWTFASVVDAYVSWLPERHRNLCADADATFMRRYVRDPAVNPWVDKPIAAVTDYDVMALVVSIRNRPAPALARNCLMKVRALFAWAMHPARRREFGLVSNPLAHLTPRVLGLTVPRRSRVLGTLELRAYLAAGERLASASDRALARSLLLTGQRLRDLIRMKWSELDLGRGLWTTAGEGCSVEQVVVLSDAMVTLLEDLRRGLPPDAGDFVFGAAATKTSSKNFSRMKSAIDRHMKETIKEASGPPATPWTWLDLRRSVLAMLAWDGLEWEKARIAVGMGRWRLGGIPNRERIRAALNRHANELDAIRRGDRLDRDWI